MGVTLHNGEFQVFTLGAVKSNGEPNISDIYFRLPVPHQQMTIKQGVKVDEVDIPGRSGKIKQPVGFDDSKININVRLFDIENKAGEVEQSADQQLEAIQAAFRDRSDPVTDTDDTATAQQSTAVPTVYSVQSRLTDTCGIKTVIFQSLDIKDTTGTNDIEVILAFLEYEPIALQVERRQREEDERKKAKDEAGDASGYEPLAAKEHEEEAGKESPLAAAFRQGKSDAMGGRPGE